MPENDTEAVKQCRICLDGEDPELGRLIRPCLCKGTISYVHVKCLQLWRNTSSSQSAFYACPQCGYRYHFARTRAMGIATNPIIIGTASAFLFTVLVLCCSFITTSVMSADEEQGTYYYGYGFYYYPVQLFRGLVRSAVEILFDDTLSLDTSFLDLGRGKGSMGDAKTSKPPGLLMRLLRRFLLGLPVVGAGSVAHMLMSVPLPFNWLRLRSRRGNGRGSRDVVAIMVLVAILVGAGRALWKVYQLTERLTKRLLLRAENVILEVG